jgi:hypothetical protein
MKVAFINLTGASKESWENHRYWAMILGTQDIVETVNVGDIGISDEKELPELATKLREFKPDVVVLFCHGAIKKIRKDAPGHENEPENVIKKEVLQTNFVLLKKIELIELLSNVFELVDNAHKILLVCKGFNAATLEQLSGKQKGVIVGSTKNVDMEPDGENSEGVKFILLMIQHIKELAREQTPIDKSMVQEAFMLTKKTMEEEKYDLSGWIISDTDDFTVEETESETILVSEALLKKMIKSKPKKPVTPEAQAWAKKWLDRRKEKGKEL